MAGMKTRIEHINAEIEELNALTKQRKREVDQAKIMIGNYKEQQNNVRNNREFDAITKEIEYQELEIELAEKRLKEYAAGVKAKKAPAGGDRGTSSAERESRPRGQDRPNWRASRPRRLRRWRNYGAAGRTSSRPRSTSVCWRLTTGSAATCATDWPW